MRPGVWGSAPAAAQPGACSEVTRPLSLYQSWCRRWQDATAGRFRGVSASVDMRTCHEGRHSVIPVLSKWEERVVGIHERTQVGEPCSEVRQGMESEPGQQEAGTDERLEQQP
jgi:hypothetical protein